MVSTLKNFDEIDQKIAFKHKIHIPLKECEEKSKLERLSRESSRSASKSHSAKSTHRNLIKEKFKVAELKAGACFIRTKIDTEYQSCALKVKEQLAKTEVARREKKDAQGNDA